MNLFRNQPNRTVRAYFLSSAFWFVMGALEGFTDATDMAAPELLANISWLVFSRVRPMHTNTMIFGFVGTGLIGAAFYFVPSLLRTPLYSEKLGRLSIWIWNISIAAGTVLLGMGYTQSREYAEWIWPVDIGILLTFAMAFYNLFQTAKHRQEKIFYVANWYVLAGLFYMFFIYFFGNAVWNPSTGAITGMPDAILAWFYGHGIVGLFLTPLAIAASYYIVPRVSQAPLYSHTLSLVGFWSILVIYTHIGAHHLLQTPAPTWLKVLAISGSVAMVVPVMTVLVNLWLTMRGRLGHFHADLGGKFVMAGLVWYIIVCLQGPLQSLPVVQKITHLNNWVIAHAHIGVLGFSGFIALGAIYYVIPHVTGKPVYNSRLVDIQYWLVLLGLTGFLIVLTMGGLIQGNSWLNGETVYRTLPMLYPYLALRAAFGVLILGGAFIGLYNVFMSLRSTKD